MEGGVHLGVLEISPGAYIPIQPRFPRNQGDLTIAYMRIVA